jgi:transcriptional regulator with XRE-family HTH domain
MSANRKQKGLTLGSVLKRRRQQLQMTQAEVADKVGCRPNYIGYLEADARRPSPKVVVKLSAALDLDRQELFFLANPEARAVVPTRNTREESSWQRFKTNKRLHTRHGITRSELNALQSVAGLGEVRNQRDFLFILQTIRQALTDD